MAHGKHGRKARRDERELRPSAGAWGEDRALPGQQPLGSDGDTLALGVLQQGGVGNMLQTLMFSWRRESPAFEHMYI